MIEECRVVGAGDGKGRVKALLDATDASVDARAVLEHEDNV